MYHICYSNPHAWGISYANGVYGNVGTGNENPLTLWGKLRDLLAIIPGDKIFFYVKQEMALKGVFEVVSDPYICTDNLFNAPNENYPLRFNFREASNFPLAVPVFELAKLIEKGELSSISSFERDTQGNFRGIRQITEREAKRIEELFYQYNPKTNPEETIELNPPEILNEEEATNLVNDITNGIEYEDPTKILITTLPTVRIRQVNTCRYEYALHAYIFRGLRENNENLLNSLLLTNYYECLLEVPLLKAQQFRSDILCIFQRLLSSPHFYSILEIKSNRMIEIEDLSQLIGYMKTFAETNAISFKSIEGIYLSSFFNPAAIQYLIHRRTVERENPIRLIRYNIDQHGIITFVQLN